MGCNSSTLQHSPQGHQKNSLVLPLITFIGGASAYLCGRALLRIRVGLKRKALGVALLNTDSSNLEKCEGRAQRRRLGLLERWYVAHSRAGTHTGFCLGVELQTSTGDAPDEIVLRKCLARVSQQFTWLRCKVRRDGVCGVDSRISLMAKDPSSNAHPTSDPIVWGDDLYVEEVDADQCRPSIQTIQLNESYGTSLPLRLQHIIQEETVRVWHDEDPTQLLWRVTLVRWKNDHSGNDKFTLILAFHHLITDGMGALQVVRAVLETSGSKSTTNIPDRTVASSCQELPSPLEDIMDTNPRLQHLLLPLFVDRFPNIASWLIPQPWKGEVVHHHSNNPTEDRSSHMTSIALLESSSKVDALRRYCSTRKLSFNSVLTAALLKSISLVCPSKESNEALRFSVEVPADERRRRALTVSYDQLGPYVSPPKVSLVIHGTADSIESIARAFSRQIGRALQSSHKAIGMMAFVREDWIAFSRKMCESTPNGVRDSLNISFLTGVDDSIAATASIEETGWHLNNVWFAQGRRGFGAAVRASVLGTSHYANATLTAFPNVVSTDKLQRIAAAWKQELTDIVATTSCTV